MKEKLTVIIMLVFLSNLPNAFAESMSKSCSGTMRYCDRYGICTDEYYYLYAYQYVKFANDGSLKKERHRFNFRGYVLGEEDDYEFSGVILGSHMIHTGPDFDLAIPWHESLSIYSVDKVTGDWEILCQ